MRARLILDSKTVLSDGRIVQRRVWQLPNSTADRAHGLKYNLYCGMEGRTIVRYDNETGKGDHRHTGPEEIDESYCFTSLAQLLSDFEADIIRLSGDMT
jgi:hypothetical protein